MCTRVQRLALHVSPAQSLAREKMKEMKETAPETIAGPMTDVTPCHLRKKATGRSCLKKRSNSARLLHFSKLTTSKTKQFCETSFKNGKLRAALTASCQCVFSIFPIHLSKLLRLPRKNDARSYEVLHLSRKIISANLKI